MKTLMRAMLVVGCVTPFSNGVSVSMTPVCANKPFGPEGESEENTYARYTPTGSLSLAITNPNLTDKFRPGQKFYADFAEVEEAVSEPPPVNNANVAEGCEKFGNPTTGQ